MKKYDNYKDSGIEWIGGIPEHWEVKRIRHLAEIYGRIGYRGYKVTDLVQKGEGAITISPSNMKEFNMDFDSCTYLSWDKYEESPEIMIYNGDILFVKTGSTYGKSSFVKDLPEKATINPQIVVLKNIESNNKLLWYIIISNIVQFQVEQSVVGGTIPTISQARINNYLFPITTDLKEQTAIANYLDRKTTEIDELIADKRRLLELYEEEKTAIINQAVTKGINPDTPMKDSGIEWLGEIPEHWQIANFNHYVFLRHGYQFRNFDFTSDGIKIIKITQLLASGKFETEKVSFIDENRLDNFKDILIKEGDILMALTGGTIGKIIRVPKVNEPLLQNYRVGNFFPINEQLSKDFLFWILSSNSILAQIFYDQRETGQPNIGKEDFGKMKIVFPKTIDEQTEIVKYIQAEIYRIDAKVNKIKKLIDLLTEYRTSLISEVVTGKIKVTE